VLAAFAIAAAVGIAALVLTGRLPAGPGGTSPPAAAEHVSARADPAAATSSDVMQPGRPGGLAG
jgi:hypothetical protein